MLAGGGFDPSDRPGEPPLGQGVVEQLLNDREGHRRDVSPHQRGIEEVDGVAHVGDDDLRLIAEVVVDADDLLD